MTHEQAHRGKNLLLARRMLTEKEVRERLNEYYNTTADAAFTEEIVNCAISSVNLTEVWTDERAHIALVHVNHEKDDKEYILIATGKNYDLVK